MVRLQVKDMKILRELDFGARQPISQIARKVRLSSEVTAYHIKQLEKQGLITGYYPVINLSKLGYLFCRFRLVLENIDSQVEEKIIELARNEPLVGWVIIAGSCNVGLVIYAKSLPEAERAYNRLTFPFSGMIKSKEFSVAHHIYHFRRNYLYQTEEDDELVWGDTKEALLDAADKIILTALSKNARIKYTDLAKKTGLTSMAVINRVRQMEKEKIILGYRCLLDLHKLGYSHHKIYLFFQKITQERRESVKQWLRCHANVVYITEAIGRSDFEFEMHIHSDHEMYEFMKKIKKEFPEIKSFENSFFHREVIIRYFPEEICDSI